MTVLLTGGAGYIGSQMAYELCDAGESAVVLDDLSTGYRDAVPAGVRLVVGDCGDASLLAALLAEEQIDAIIHFAASVVVDESVRNPLHYYRNNTGNAHTLIAAAVQAGVPHFIFSSTAAVYGNPNALPVTEDAPTRPVSPYGRSKLMTEMILGDAAAAHGFCFAVLRYFNVAAADPRLRTGQSTPAPTHLIGVAVQTALGLRPGLQVFGSDYPTRDGTCIRDYIHVADLARAHLDALVHLRRGGESVTLNLGYGRGSSVLEVVEAVKRISGVDFPVAMAGRRPGDAAAVVASPARARAVLGWQPRFDDLDTIVRHALAWGRILAARSAPRSRPGTHGSPGRPRSGP